MSDKHKETPKDKIKEKEDWRNSIDWEKVYKVLLTIVTGLIPFFLYDMSKFRDYCERNGMKYQSIWVIPQACVIAVVLVIYRNIVCRKLFYNFIFTHMNKKYTQDREVRTIKAIKWTSDIIYYSCATLYAVFFFGHKKWFPLTLHKDWYDQDIMYQWPDKVQDDVSYYMDIYLLIQFGQHIYAFFELCARKNTDPKFYEFTLHHVLALTLIFYSTQNNFMMPAVILLVLHDVGDITLAWFKLYGVFRTDPLFYINTGVMIINWFITRVYIYPKGVILPFVEYFNQLYKVVGEEKEYQTYTKACYIYMLVLCSLLLIMHIYWFATMLTMLFVHLKQIIVTSKPVTFQNDHDFHTKESKEKKQKVQ